MNAPLIRESRAARALIKANTGLTDALPDMDDLAIRLGHGDLFEGTSAEIDRASLAQMVRSFEVRLLAMREAWAAAAGVPDSEDVSTPEDMENALIGALERHYGVGNDAPPRLHGDIGTAAPYVGGLR